MEKSLVTPRRVLQQQEPEFTVIDSEIGLADYGRGLEQLESRRVFGKIIVHF